MNKLPIFKIKRKLYFWDKKLSEYRNINNPFEVLSGNYIDESNIDIELIALNNGNI